MYGRAERYFSYVHPTGTGTVVGPGLYDVFVDQKWWAKSNWGRSNRFGRDSFFIGNLFPIDGLYAAEKAKKYIHGCSSLRDKSRRFHYVYNDSPGPASYSLMNKYSSWGRLKRSCGFQEKRMKFGRRQTRILGKSSLSIPNKRNNSYREHYGRMVQEDLPFVDCNLSPAHYYIRIDPNSNQRRYQGCKWSGRTAERDSVFQAREGPCPADYDVYFPPNKVSTFPFDTEFVRWPKSLQLTAIKEGFPSPADYEVPLQLLHEQIDFVPSKSRRPFNSTDKKFRYKYSDNPGPGTYYKEDVNLSTLSKKRKNRSKVPFEVQQKRFATKHNKPTEFLYHVPGCLSNEQPFYYRPILKGAFNVNATRFPNVKIDIDPKMTELPSSIKLDKMPSASFNSKSDKIAKVLVQRTPSPTRYDVIKAFRALNDHKSLRVPVTSKIINKKLDRDGYLADDTRIIGFDSGCRRFGPLTDSQDPHPIDLGVPGPGLMNLCGELSKKGRFISHGKRSLFDFEITPGPGDYEIAPHVADTVLTGTWNVSLDNPLLFKRPMYHRLRQRIGRMTLKPSVTSVTTTDHPLQQLSPNEMPHPMTRANSSLTDPVTETFTETINKR